MDNSHQLRDKTVVRDLGKPYTRTFALRHPLRVQIPNIRHHRPGCHQTHQVLREALPSRVPERLREEFIILDRDRAHLAPEIERASFEQHAVLVVDAGAFGEN